MVSGSRGLQRDQGSAEGDAAVQVQLIVPQGSRLPAFGGAVLGSCKARCDRFKLAARNSPSAGGRWVGSGEAWQLATLKLNFLGYRRDRVTHLFDNGLQFISGYAEPPRPRPYLSRIRQVDFIAKRRMLYAMHGGVSLIAGQRHPNRFVPLCPWAPPCKRRTRRAGLPAGSAVLLPE